MEYDDGEFPTYDPMGDPASRADRGTDHYRVAVHCRCLLSRRPPQRL